MAVKIKNKLRQGSNRSFLARDFESLRRDLIEQAQIFFPDKIKDFSEASVGGLLVDLAASIGDTMSFYLDHQFRELDPLNAVELNNITTHLRNAGVKIRGAAPSVVEVTISAVVPAESDPETSLPRPKRSCLPTILENTVFKSDSGVFFNLTEDVDLSELNVLGDLVASSQATKFVDGVPTQYTVTRRALAMSGKETVQTVAIGSTHVPFREITLNASDVSEILSVVDSDGEKYYEVDSLSQDTVFVPVDNTNPDDFDLVSKSLEIIPAPRRFVSITTLTNRKTKIRFGSGDSEVLDDDIIPDPSTLSLDLYGKKSFSKFSVDPNLLLGTQTLGLSPKSTTLRITYRHGGGLSHNVDAGTIKTIEGLNVDFKGSPSPEEVLATRQTIAVTNDRQARGGANAPSVEELRNLIQSARNAQSRTVTRDDLLARIYTLPSSFGRVFRVGLANNPINPLSLMMYIICLDRFGKLTVAPDTLKNNLSKYLNEFRLISDAIDVLDASVVNFGIKYEVYLDKTANKPSVLQTINTRLADALQLKYFQIDQPLIIDDIINLIINTDGVISLTDLTVHGISGVVTPDPSEKFGIKETREYSNTSFNFEANTKKGIIRGPLGTIFELRHPENDIKGIAI